MSDEDTKKLNNSDYFNIDAEETGALDIPSVTRLLNRKKLESAQTKEAEPISSEIEIQEKNGEFAIPTEIELTTPIEASTSTALELNPSESGTTPPPFEPKPQSQAKVQPAKRSLTSSQASSSQKELAEWTIQTLKRSQDPLAQAVTLLIDEYQAGPVLFLALRSAPATADSESVPYFEATAGFDLSEKRLFWTGLNWKPEAVPELWNIFVQDGFVELPPPGTQTVASSVRNITRSAYGVRSEEWITLVRVGPEEACRGVLAIVSHGSLNGSIEKVQEICSVLPEKSRSKTAAA